MRHELTTTRTRNNRERHQNGQKPNKRKVSCISKTIFPKGTLYNCYLGTIRSILSSQNVHQENRFFKTVSCK